MAGAAGQGAVPCVTGRGLGFQGGARSRSKRARRLGDGASPNLGEGARRWRVATAAVAARFGASSGVRGSKAGQPLGCLLDRTLAERGPRVERLGAKTDGDCRRARRRVRSDHPGACRGPSGLIQGPKGARITCSGGKWQRGRAPWGARPRLAAISRSGHSSP